MRNIILSIFVICYATISGAQVLTTLPEVPVATGMVSIRFNTSEEPGALNGYTGRLFAHTGLNFSDGSKWQNVIGTWGVNASQPEFQYIGFNTYNLTLSPDLYTFYGATTSKEITQIAIVIRSEDASKQTQDYFIDIFPEGLNINLIAPAGKNSILDLNEVIDIQAAASSSDTLALYQNGAFLTGSNTGTLDYSFTGSSYGEHEMVLWAANQTDEIRDTFYVFVKSDPIVEELPPGMVDGINYLSDTSVILSFFAPGKEYVFAIGDFSNWMAREAYYMKKTPGGQHFWVQINGLDPSTLYRFYYQVEGPETVLPYNRFADPYTRLFLDPYHHKHISEDTYPGISGLLEGLEDIQYSVIHTGKQPYLWKVSDFTPPEKTNLVIYELLLRDFLADHDWLTLIDTLDYLDNLGINAIELMPINEFDGNESWGYDPKHFFAPDMYYGPAEDLKAFIDECHSRGIAVIQDIVFNHIVKFSTLAALYLDNQEYPSVSNPWVNADFDLSDPNGWYQARHPYNVFFDMDHSSVHTQFFMDRALRFWMEEYKIDGFRFDLTKGFTQKSTYLGTNNEGYAIYNEGEASAYDPERIYYLKRMADAVWAFNEDAYVILEHFCDNTEEKELTDYGMMIWGNANHNYNQATMGYNSESDFSWGVSYKRRNWSNPALIGYMESHDEERLMYKNLTYGNSAGNYDVKDLSTALRRIEQAAAFFFTIPGPKMIWQFGELGYDFNIDYDCRICNKPIRWDYFNQPDRYRVYKTFSALIHLKLSEPAFTTEDYQLTVNGSNKIIALNHPDMDVRVVGNFDVKESSVIVNFGKNGTWYEFFSGDAIEITNLQGQFVLDPGEYLLYTTKKLEQPDIPAAIEDSKVSVSGTSVYPVPAEDFLQINAPGQAKRIMVFNVNGGLIEILQVESESITLDVSDYNTGVYVLRIEYGDRIDAYHKFIVH